MADQNIRHVWGPFRSTMADRFTATMLERGSDPEIKWYFHGVRSDGSMMHWILTYKIKSRTFSASGQKARGECLPENRDMYLPAAMSRLPSFEGRVVDVLRSRLPALEMARATAASMRRR